MASPSIPPTIAVGVKQFGVTVVIIVAINNCISTNGGVEIGSIRCDVIEDVVFDPQITARKLDLEKPNLVEVFEDLSKGMMSNSAAMLHLIIIVDISEGERRRRQGRRR
ncbi:hypothetical protein L6452_30163 [Arctium lappa]|uniref:Uncharacterized protein n=1 Tax=Arctium lappa TaxID=4217 RepID=A0ACB8ZIY5_ARCLA|nr:hypothetical protein L6452_30163 [Arctium lappa]